jgi:alkylhydroperoxidase/carboxymuconolactone decarboxylase family protein YurZ
MSAAEEAFRRLTIGDPALVASVANPPTGAPAVQRLDARTEALLQIAALIALDAPPSSFRPVVEMAMRSGARLEELLAGLLAVAGTVGSARVVSAAPRIAMAAGYDVDAALEELDAQVY